MPRICSRCLKTLPLEAFARDPDKADGLRYACRECDARRRSTYRRHMTPGPRGARVEPSRVGAELSGGRQKEGKETALPAHEAEPLEGGRSLVLAIPDLHLPFHSRAALSQLLDLCAEIQPDVVVQLGDFYDLFAFSKYPRSANLMTPNDELDQGRAYGEWLWQEIRRLAPSATCYVLAGNHDARAHKRALEHFQAAERFVDDGVRELMTFPGVTLVPVTRERLEVDGIVYQHGHLRMGNHAQANRQHTVTGHLHRGGVVHVQDGRAWELNCGWLGSVDFEVFSYVGQRRAHGTTLGCGVVDSLGPRFIPLG